VRQSVAAAPDHYIFVMFELKLSSRHREESEGAISSEDLAINKTLFEVGGGFQVAKGPLFVDVSYRFRKFLGSDIGINVSGLYAGAGVGF